MPLDACVFGFKVCRVQGLGIPVSGLLDFSVFEKSLGIRASGLGCI